MSAPGDWMSGCDSGSLGRVDSFDELEAHVLRNDPVGSSILTSERSGGADSSSIQGGTSSAGEGGFSSMQSCGGGGGSISGVSSSGGCGSGNASLAGIGVSVDVGVGMTSGKSGGLGHKGWPMTFIRSEAANGRQCQEGQDPRTEKDSLDISEILDALTQSGDGGSGSRSQQEVFEMLQRMMQDQQQSQQRLENVEEKLSRLERQNMGLAMENFKLRAKASKSAQSQNSPQLRDADMVAERGSPNSSWTTSTSTVRLGSTTPASSGVFLAPRVPVARVGTGVASVALVAGGASCSAPAPKRGAGGGHPRSESPGGRAHWAATTAAAASPTAPRSVGLHSSPPVSPRPQPVAASCRSALPTRQVATAGSPFSVRVAQARC